MPQNSGVCGAQPLCFESNDFAATITDFRTSQAQDAWGTKLIDMMVHFQNKTSQPLSLAYADGSGYALDDRGNRYGLNTRAGGVRGMGVVAGNNMDPQFTLTPGGAGDARFEYGWQPGGAIAGTTFEVGLDIREINRVEGNQYVLGSDTLMHYTGLANGAGTAPGAMAYGSTPGQGATQGQPCQPAGSTGSLQQGVSNLAQTLSNARSMIAGSQGAGTSASNAAGSVPCASGASGLGNGIQSGAPAATGGYGNPAAYGTNGVYANPGAYATPGAYSPQGAYGNSGTYSAPAGYGTTAAPAQSGAVSSQPVSAPRVTAQPVAATKAAVPVGSAAVAPVKQTVAPVTPAAQVTKAAAKPAAKPVAKTPPPPK